MCFAESFYDYMWNEWDIMDSVTKELRECFDYSDEEIARILGTEECFEGVWENLSDYIQSTGKRVAVEDDFGNWYVFNITKDFKEFGNELTELFVNDVRVVGKSEHFSNLQIIETTFEYEGHFLSFTSAISEVNNLSSVRVHFFEDRYGYSTDIYMTHWDGISLCCCRRNEKISRFILIKSCSPETGGACNCDSLTELPQAIRDLMLDRIENDNK